MRPRNWRAGINRGGSGHLDSCRRSFFSGEAKARTLRLLGRRQSGEVALPTDSRPASDQSDERGCFYDQLPRVFTRSRRLWNEE
jgi:hypothetical protein